MRKTHTFVGKPVYLGLSILGVSKIVMYAFWYNHAKPKHREKAKLYYMDRGSLIAYIKAEDLYIDIVKDLETRFGTLNMN